MTTTFPPPVPPGRRLTLPGRGTTFVREAAGPPGAPTVLLLHGWIATADLNWWTAYADLGRQFRIVALDHRGHGNGLRERPFSLQACAGDAAAVLELLGAAPAIAVGYSMGGPIAQLLWRDYPEVVSGLVLCATSATFPVDARRRAALTAGMYGMTLAPGAVRHRLFEYMLSRAGRSDGARDWLLSQVKGHRMPAILAGGRELGRFDSRAWLGEIDVPTAVLVTTKDDVVSPRRQAALVQAIPGAVRHDVDGDHLVCAHAPKRFVPTLVAACREVSRRGRERRATA